MANNFPFEFEPIIEYVDVVRRNTRDTNKVHFKVNGDKYEVIKWCRRNFGERGDGWDFIGGIENIEVIIWSSRLITMWELWQE